MKKAIYFSIVILILVACDKNNDNNQSRGNLAIKMTYNCSVAAGQSAQLKTVTNNLETDYTQFGNYIGSITPTALIGKFLDMRIQSWTPDSTMWNTNLNIIDNNTAIDSTNRLADFSNNAVVNFTLNTSMMTTNDDITYNIFVFIPLFFYQEFELPAQYDNTPDLQYLRFGSEQISFDSFVTGGTRVGRLVKGSYEPLLAPIFDANWTGFKGNFPEGPKTYVFGDTETTHMFYSNNSGQSAQSIDNPLGQSGYIIRSNAYNPITIQAIPNGETITYNGTMTLDITNLIQIYAGKDNIAYTSDDIFVYAPNFWERLSVSIIEE